MLRERVRHILFLCTGNSARSIMAEAYMNFKGAPRWRAFSAGSKPTGRPHPLAIATLSAYGVNPEAPRSKSWDEFAAASAVLAAIPEIVTREETFALKRRRRMVCPEIARVFCANCWMSSVI